MTDSNPLLQAWRERSTAMQKARNEKQKDGLWMTELISRLKEANKIWETRVKELKGDIEIDWKFDREKNDFECYLETGEVFRP